MSAFTIVPIPQAIADEVRRTRKSPQYGHPAHHEIAQGKGPCRVCLGTFRPNEEERLLFTYDPFAGLSDYPCPGPIFVHAHACAPFHGTSVLPPELSATPMVVEAYGDDRWPISREAATGEAVGAAITRLLAVPAVAYLHLRHRKAGCYIARVERS
jgi:hypothetical protein